MAERAELQVTAVVVLWNSGRAVLDLLRSLEGDFARGLRVVVVDNASSDESLPALEGFLAAFPFAECVEVVHSEENLGFTGGVNLGTDRALQAKPSPAFIWLLNPDTSVGPGALAELLGVASQTGAAVVTTTHSAHVAPGSWPKPFYTRFRARPNTHEGWIEAEVYNGACALFTALAIHELVGRTGHFQDEALFMDWDEWDCARRLHRLDLRIVHTRNVALEHRKGSRTLGPTPGARLRQYYQSRNPIVVARRYMPAWQFWPVLPVHLARDLSWLLRLRLQGKQPHELAYLEGAFDAFRGRRGRWRKHPD